MTTGRCARCGSELAPSSRVCQSCGAVARATPAPAEAVAADAELDTDATVDVRVIRAAAARIAAAEEERATLDASGAGLGDAPAVVPSVADGLGTPTTPVTEYEPAAPVLPGVEAASAEPPLPFPTPSVGGVRRAAITLGGIDRSWSARWRRGVALARISYDLLRSHTGLLWVPVLAASAVFGIFLVDMLVTLVLPSALALLFFLAAVGVAVTVAMLSQAVIVHRIGTVAEGGNETNAQALAAVLPKWRVLAAWGCLSFSVGVAIRFLERGRGPLGWFLRILAVAINVAWSAATFFVVPVILYEDLAVRPAIARSRQLLRASWGEGVIGVGIMALFFNLVGLAAGFLVMLLSFAHLLLLAILVAIVAVVGINLLSFVATPIFTLALYRFAVDGSTHFGLEPADLAAAFRPRNRRRAQAAAAA